jgi:hypothetical protein
MANVVLVTGGTGLVGKAIEHIIQTEPEGSRFGKKPGETWIFASSSEADLRSDSFPTWNDSMLHASWLYPIEIPSRRVNFTKSTSQHM